MVVYLITNKINGKRYVGQTINSIEHRWSQHIAHSRNPKRSGILCSAIRKYSEKEFEIRVLIKCNSIEEANHRETYCIRLLNTLAPHGYNLDGGGKNNVMHPDTKKKLSVAHTGKKRGTFSDEHRRRISEANKGQNLGGILSEETRLKISIANRGINSPMFGKKQSEKWKAAIAEANKGNKYWVGRKHREDTKKKLSEKNKGRFLGLSNPFWNKKHTKESIDKMSKANDKTKIRVLCLNNNTVYDSKNSASKELNVGRNQISAVISGKIPHVKGFVFRKA